MYTQTFTYVYTHVTQKTREETQCFTLHCLSTGVLTYFVNCTIVYITQLYLSKLNRTDGTRLERPFQRARTSQLAAALAVVPFTNELSASECFMYSFNMMSCTWLWSSNENTVLARHTKKTWKFIFRAKCQVLTIHWVNQYYFSNFTFLKRYCSCIYILYYSVLCLYVLSNVLLFNCTRLICNS